MYYYWKQISKQETAFIKAFGILFILFHNYFHFITPWAGENEFVFSIKYGRTFLNLLKENPADICRLLFAFFGHYGVQLFIFISGYGLFLSYQNKQVRWITFFKNHLLKLYPAYMLAACLFLALFKIHYHAWPLRWQIKYVLFDLLFIQNFIPDHVYSMVGSWWFFSLIVQLYAVFPVILSAYRRFGTNAILGIGSVSWFLTLLINPWTIAFGYNLYYLFLSRLPVFCLGIIFARMSDFKLPYWLIGLSFLIAIAGNFNAAAWPFSMLAISLFLLVIIRKIIPFILPFKKMSSFLSWIGINSLFIFAVHGFLRWPFVNKAIELQNPVATILLGLAFFLVALLAAWIIKKMEVKIQKFIVQPLFARSQ